jgi:hypothetical protein
MTIALAWQGTRPDGREYLYMASDSRVRGGRTLDTCPKILPLPRSDCAICFAGDTNNTYPLMLQLWNAVAAHQPARERSLDIVTLKAHLLRVFTDLINSVKDSAYEFEPRDAQFIFGGYSWRNRSFRLWTVYYAIDRHEFAAREARGFHSLLHCATLIGDRARLFRSELVRALNARGEQRMPVNLEPLTVLANVLRQAGEDDTIGGPPQFLRIAAHMNTRPFVVRWKDADTLFGRKLFHYENVDYWTIDPFSLRITKPRKFGVRDSDIEPPRRRSESQRQP